MEDIIIKFAHYGEEREVDATNEELEIFGILQELAAPNKLRLVRKSSSYVSAVFGEWDVARFKYTDRTHWILFPVFESSKEKHKFDDVETVREYADLVENTFAHIEKYSK